MTDLKTGYWLGSTPAAQQKTKFLGIASAAIAAGLTIVMLSRAFQFGEAAPGDPRVVLPAPQAAIMKSLVEGFMSQQPVAYILFGAGAVIAVIMEMLGVPALIFALGMYLPLELNTPALVGGFLAHFLNKRAETKGASHPRARDRDRLGPDGRRRPRRRLRRRAAAPPRLHRGLAQEPVLDVAVSQTVSAVLFVGLCVYVWKAAHGGDKGRIRGLNDEPRPRSAVARGTISRSSTQRAYGQSLALFWGVQAPPEPPLGPRERWPISLGSAAANSQLISLSRTAFT